MLPIDHYLKLRERPTGIKAMKHKWRDLSFLHYPIDPDELRFIVPSELTIDTYPDKTGKEQAWVGLIPFWMTGVRPTFLPPLPGLSTFPETNLRTYVHHDGKNPGVWFFSLDAANRVACATARQTYGLPYFWASMQVKHSEGKITYESVRHHPSKAFHKLTTLSKEPLGTARVGSLEFFLVERYLLYSKLRRKLNTAQVHHPPYELTSMSLLSIRETITQADNVPQRPFEHFLYSPGVDVDVYAVTKT